ncbi:hypothetical protein DL762_007385 [Monosporascus cannonballus]|uniref:Uncharacterized protein n=1 Tax=Monosporascus cannonballus TaxID=155416 RepID=A0ABY0H047_9PEZI|nr:hypothetical protein DL762_007385 [Monosporascus cannonballus]
MFEDLIKAVGELDVAESPSEIPQEVLRWTSQSSFTTLRSLYVILCSEHNIIVRDGSDEVALGEIAENIGEVIRPNLNIEPPDQVSRGTLGLKILSRIRAKHRITLSPSTLISITAFVNTEDPWTTIESASLAPELLDERFQSQSQEQRNKFITEDILSDFLRPLFSKSRPATVTASGRKAEFVEPSRYDNASAEAEARKPWKYGQRYAITVFEWAVSQSDLLQKSWHLFTPVLLTLLDEPQTALKVRALDIFRAFWARCPGDLMRQTGLAQVFEDAVFPAVLYLPGLTPESESIAILNAAYPALIIMAGIGLESTTDEPQSNPKFTEAQQKLLDKIIREGILVGYNHASEHTRLIELFCEKLRCVVNGMGILAIKHLKNLIPMVSEIMTDPFGAQHPPSLLSAIKLLRAIMSTCWPRIPHYCNEIIKALMLCWLNIEEGDAFPDGDPGPASLKSELTKAADMLSAVMQAAKMDMEERVAPLVEKEPQLRELFKISHET